MGTPKAWLSWRGSTLLDHTVGVLAQVVTGPVLVVRAAGQELPELSADVLLIDDPEPDRGPVVALGAGLAAAAAFGAELALVTATDLPFLHPAYLRAVLAALPVDADTVLPVVAGHEQPLATVYRTALATTLAAMAASGEYRLRALHRRCRVRELDEPTLLADPALARADPTLRSLRNVNAPDDYRGALAEPAAEPSPGNHPRG
jgi:molybdopterin-guanine dinucleotide biosynthesis protein A